MPRGGGGRRPRAQRGSAPPGQRAHNDATRPCGALTTLPPPLPILATLLPRVPALQLRGVGQQRGGGTDAGQGARHAPAPAPPTPPTPPPAPPHLGEDPIHFAIAASPSVDDAVPM